MHLFKKSLIILLLIFLGIQSSYNQVPFWDWAINPSESQTGPMLEPLEADIQNNYYFRARYSDSIGFPDTSFVHNVSSSTINYAIAKYSTKGDFINAIDFYTLSTNYISYPQVFTDNDLNIYISGGFVNQVFFQDTAINHCNSPYFNFHKDLFFVKLDKDYNVVWADIIGGTLQDNQIESILYEDNIYIATEHYANTYFPTTVSYFEQDTGYHNQDFTSILKMNKNKVLEWRKEIIGNVSGSKLIVRDDQVHFLSRLLYMIEIDGDTLINPYSPNDKQPWFTAIFNLAGELLEFKLIDNGVALRDVTINENSEYILSGNIYDTLFYNQDTIAVPEDSTYQLIAKLDSEFNFVWANIFSIDQVYSSFRIQTEHDKIYFTYTVDGNFTIGDTTFNFGNNYGLIIGSLYEENGEWDYLSQLQSSEEISAWYPLFDNCGGFIVNGFFNGTAIFGEDTLVAFPGDENDYYVAKLMFQNYDQVSIGNDTLACNEFTIHAPEGYLYYSWNNEITNQSWKTITETGQYYLGCTDGNGCWKYDTVFVEIIIGYFPNLITDDSLSIFDTITLSVPEIYDSYLWSNGATGSSIELVGNNLGVGDHDIWVTVTKVVCTITDSITLKVYSNFGTNSNPAPIASPYPNPFQDELILNDIPKLTLIEIYSIVEGKCILRKSFNQYTNSYILKTNVLTAGVYSLKVTSNNKQYCFKILKQ